MDPLFYSLMSYIRLLAQDAQITLVNKIAPTLPLMRADGVKLRQIFTNLVSNAIKFTPEGGTITLEAYQLDDGRIASVVSDTGIGMSDKDIQVALTPFGQVDAGRSRWRDGTGLGLPIAKSLVELHSGEVRVMSVKDKGTQIWVLLPPPTQLTIGEARDAILGTLRIGTIDPHGAASPKELLV